MRPGILLQQAARLLRLFVAVVGATSRGPLRAIGPACSICAEKQQVPHRSSAIHHVAGSSCQKSKLLLTQDLSDVFLPKAQRQTKAGWYKLAASAWFAYGLIKHRKRSTAPSAIGPLRCTITTTFARRKPLEESRLAAAECSWRPDNVASFAATVRHWLHYT